MKSSTCRFCDHANPAGSRFCNACGSPLDLRPCARCDAVNNALADRCYQCGESLAADEGREVAEVAAGADLADASDVPANAGRPTTLDNIPVALARRFDPGAPGADAPEPVPTRRHRLPDQVSKPRAIGEPTTSSATSPDTDGAGRTSRRPASRSVPAAVSIGEPTTSATPPDTDGAGRTSRRPARRGVPVAVPALIVLAVIGAAGYYAYVNGIPAGVIAALDRAMPAHRVPAAVPIAPAPAKAQAGTVDSQPPAGTAGSQPPGGTVGSSSSVVRSPSATRSTRASAADAPSSPASTAASGASVAPAEAGDAPEGRPSVTARKPRPHESARASVRDTPEAAVPRGSVDRDAIETRRLIARDLAGFVSPSAPGAPPSQ